MYGGEQGPAREWAMRLLAKIGDALGAERLIKISSAEAGYPDFYSDLVPQEVIEDIWRKGYGVPCCSCHIEPDLSKLSKETYRKWVAYEKAAKDMNVFLMGTCAPYAAGWCPIKGAHVAYGESSIVAYTNSVLGVRTHGETFPSELASAISGRTPYWGLHTDEGRKGKLLVEVEAELSEPADYYALGYYVGWIAGIRVPVFKGVFRDIGAEHLKGLGAALAVSGGVGLYHVVGVTPEAPSLGIAFGGEKPQEAITVGKQEIRQAYDALCTHGSKEVDYVVLGCPHYTLLGLWKVYNFLKGKKIHKDVTLWVLVPSPIREVADRMELTEAIRAAGGRLGFGACWEFPTSEAYLGDGQGQGLRVVATDSAKCGHYVKGAVRPGFPKVDVWFGSTEDCLKATVTGRWGG